MKKIPQGLKSVMGFGKYHNLTVEEVLAKDPSYITWALRAGPEWFALDTQANQVYDVLKKRID